MKFKYIALMVIAPLVFILDQLTKWFVVSKIAFAGHINVIPGYFDIVHFTNFGAAFGILSDSSHSQLRTIFFCIVSVVALGAIGFYIYHLKDNEKAVAVALSLVVGGIFGNGIDRIRLGSVTDFLSFYVGDKILWGVKLEWPAFNVADMAITTAMFLLLFSVLRGEKK